MTRSEIFSQYNKARAAARQGKLDEKSVNKALGILQMKEERPYRTTINSCTCPARARHPGKACKHMIAAMIAYRIEHPVIESNIALQPNRTAGFCRRCGKPVGEGEGVYHYSTIEYKKIVEHKACLS